MTPTSLPSNVARTADLNGRSTCSVTGSASMSARSATTGPGFPPRSTPLTPACPPPGRTPPPGPGLPPPHPPDPPGSRHAGPHFDPEAFEMIRHQLRRAGFAVTELGVLVDVAPPPDDERVHRRGSAVDFGRQCIGTGPLRAQRSRAECGQNDRDQTTHRILPVIT